jgi:hypothetical protein
VGTQAARSSADWSWYVLLPDISLWLGVSGMGNRVLHPPTSPVRRESFNGYPVVVENLVSSFVHGNQS